MQITADARKAVTRSWTRAAWPNWELTTGRSAMFELGAFGNGMFWVGSWVGWQGVGEGGSRIPE